MSKTVINYLECQVVEEDIHLTLFELCQVCHASEDMITSLVIEGVLELGVRHAVGDHGAWTATAGLAIQRSFATSRKTGTASDR